MLIWAHRLSAGGLLGVLIARLVGLEQGPLFAMAMGLWPIVLGLAYPLLVGSVLLRQQALSVLALALVGAHILLVMPSTGAPPAACQGTPLRVVAANVLKTNEQVVPVSAAILALEPDVVASRSTRLDWRPASAPAVWVPHCHTRCSIRTRSMCGRRC